MIKIISGIENIRFPLISARSGECIQGKGLNESYHLRNKNKEIF